MSASRPPLTLRLGRLDPRRLPSTAEWRFLGALTAASPALAATWWALVAVRGALPAAFSIAVGVLVGAVQQGRSLTMPLVVMGTLFILMNALAPVHDAVAQNLGARVGSWLHHTLLRASTAPPGIAHLERPDLADSLAHARQFDLGISAPTLAQAMGPVGSGFAQIAAGLAQAIVLGRYSWWASLALALAWASTHVLLRDSSGWRAYRVPDVVEAERHADYSYRLGVEAVAAKEVRLFGLADWVIDRFRTRRRRVVDLLFEQGRLRRGPVRWGLLVVVAANALVFGMLAWDGLRGAIGLGPAVVYAQAAIGVAALAFGGFDWWFRSSAEPVPEVLDLGGRMAPVGALASGGRQAGTMPRREVRFRGVRFGYRPEGQLVLDGVDLVIPAGSWLAIVGVNGAGKTTLAKLLCRLYDPLEGAIEVDGTDLRELDLDAWRGRVAAVFQDFIRFELPLRVNVAPQGAAGEDLVRALETSRAGELASLDTVLSRAYEGGTDLSGGQWQRVALSRALCKVQQGAGVVLLDEPTAQLDVRAEAEIFDRLLEATRGCTTILISHRLSSVRHADRICVLEGGEVIELGTHDELMARGGRYRTMFDLQAARFSEVAPVEAEDDGARS